MKAIDFINKLQELWRRILMEKINTKRAYELLDKFKDNLFTVEFVSDEEAEMLLNTILFWKTHSEAYFDLLDAR